MLNRAIARCLSAAGLRYSEDMLDCCAPLDVCCSSGLGLRCAPRPSGELTWPCRGRLVGDAALQRVKEQGITFEEFACLGRCNGLQISSYHADTV